MTSRLRVRTPLEAAYERMQAAAQRMMDAERVAAEAKAEYELLAGVNR